MSRGYGRNRWFGIAVGWACALAARGADAMPAPQAPEELLRESDLVVEVDVLSVTKTGRVDAPVWRARLQVRRVIKGRLPGGVMRYEFVPPTPGLAGEINASVFAGERLRMYLVLEGDEYTVWASNGIEPLVDFPASRRTLPPRHGATIDARGAEARRYGWLRVRRAFCRGRWLRGC